jgi:hypothetical protein
MEKWEVKVGQRLQREPVQCKHRKFHTYNHPYNKYQEQVQPSQHRYRSKHNLPDEDPDASDDQLGG